MERIGHVSYFLSIVLVAIPVFLTFEHGGGGIAAGGTVADGRFYLLAKGEALVEVAPFCFLMSALGCLIFCCTAFVGMAMMLDLDRIGSLPKPSRFKNIGVFLFGAIIITFFLRLSVQAVVSFFAEYFRT